MYMYHIGFKSMYYVHTVDVLVLHMYTGVIIVDHLLHAHRRYRWGRP
jgi:hypothetical protein